jgi:hypothetical protein
MKSDAWDWSEEEFGRAELGDARRTARLVAMGAAACERPSGKVAAVFGTDRDREGVYDFLESEHVAAEEILASVVAATGRRCRDLPYVVVPVDGTSISVVDRARAKDFGSVGSDSRGSRGLKVIDALAVDPEGMVLGWLDLKFWTRTANRKVLARGSRVRKMRPLEEKETRFWVDGVTSAATALDEQGVRGWFQIDREGDARDILLALKATSHWWTVRGGQDRSLELEGGSTDTLRSQMSARPVLDTYTLDVTARPGRKPRAARMVVRVAEVVIRLRKPRTNDIQPFPVFVVWAREEGTTPAKEEPIDWLLFTNRHVASFADATLVIHGYSQRWRVEECHRTWKSGACDVEATQLESAAAVTRWAVILAAVATRIERLKRMARTKPDLPAVAELTPLEVQALKLLKFGANAADGMPTIGDVVDWLAELGGFTHKYSGRPPGATVLDRGLRYLRPAVRMLAIQRSNGK